MCELCRVLTRLAVGAKNEAALERAMTSNVIRCSECECAIATLDGTEDDYMIHLLDGRVYCGQCILKAAAQ